MTDVTVAAEAVEEAQPVGLDDRLIGQLVDRAKAGGVRLTPDSGLDDLDAFVLEDRVEGGGVPTVAVGGRPWDGAATGGPT
jgi:putative transposase